MDHSIILTINGRFIAKKNSRRFFRNPRTGKRFSAPSEAFEDYKTLAIQQIRKQLRGGGGNLAASIAAPRRKVRLEPPYEIEYYFFVKGKGVIDVDNAMASINDILQDAGVIDNDRNIILGSFEKRMGEPEWCARVKITSLSD
jgi:Holliday junction resolvase RusA-like endonuclease